MNKTQGVRHRFWLVLFVSAFLSLLPATFAQLQIELVPMLTLNAESNMIYRLDYTEEISVASTWVFLTNLTLISDQGFYIDTTAASGQKRFYRASVLSPYTNIVLQPPLINSQPVDISPIEGSSVTLAVVAIGSEPLVYQWYQNGLPIPNSTNSILMIPNILSPFSGQYIAFIHNPAGSAVSRAVTVTVLPPESAPSILEHPASQNVYAGTTALLHVKATGMPTPSFQWYRNGVIIKDSAKRTGTQTPDLSITNSQTIDAGKFFVVVSNSMGIATSQVAQLTVSPAPLLPVIKTQPKSQSAKAGTNLTLTVSTTGTAPLRYQWFFDSEPIISATNASLILSQLALEQSGEYHVVISNAAGNVSSQKAVITVYESPQITAQPQGGEVWAGESFSFLVEGIGTEPLSYQWRKNGSTIAGATNDTYQIPATKSADSGAYSAVIKNWAGSVTSANATLTIRTLAPESLVGMNMESINNTYGYRVIHTFVSSTKAAETGNNAGEDYWQLTIYRYTKTGDNTGRYQVINARSDEAKDLMLEFTDQYNAKASGILGNGQQASWTLVIHSWDARLAPAQLEGQNWKLTKPDGYISYYEFDSINSLYLADENGTFQLPYQYRRTGNNTASMELTAPDGRKASASLYFTAATTAVAVAKDFDGDVTERLMTLEHE